MNEVATVDKLLSVRQASKMFGIPVNTLYDLINAGVIPVLKLRAIKIRQVSMLNFLEEYDGKDLSDPKNIKSVSIESIIEERIVEENKVS